MPSYVPVILYLHKQRGVPAPQEGNRRAGALHGVRGTGANASRDFRQMVFFAAMAMHSRKFHTRFIFLIREHNACLEREIRCCAYCNYGSCLFFNLGGGVRRVILMGFYLLRRTPPPHTLAPIGVWCGLQWLSIRHQARPQGHEKSHSLPLTLPGFFHGL